MYNSPINILMDDIGSQIAKQIVQQQDEQIYQAVVNCGVIVDKDEPFRALQYDRNQYAKGYADGKADAEPKWIPVTERLPEVDTPVLTYRETGQNVELLWQRGCQKRWDYDEFTPYPVTHWAYLPEPPKGE